jgi:hypothetical protein
VPVAVNCWSAPLVIVGLAGVTAMETRVGALTVRLVLPDTAPSVALIVLCPGATAWASPLAVIVATEVVPELQVTEPVRLAVVVSL